MIPYVGVYASEQAAKSAAGKLDEAGYTDFRVILASDVTDGPAAPFPREELSDVPMAEAEHAAPEPAASGGSPSLNKARELVAEMVAAEMIPGGCSAAAVRGLMNGHSVVGVATAFGFGEAAVELMSEDGDVLEPGPSSDPAPLSDWFGWKVLSDTQPSVKLTKPGWSFSGMIGMALLSSEAAPLSKMIGFKPLTPNRDGIWQKSLGFPMLSSNAAPLSSLLSMPTTASRPEVLLSDDPAPLSSLFGLSVLSRRDGEP
ncbi:MAG: hypothetical protein AAGH41_03185 [Pseudomonadota bacterium]